MKTLTEYFKSFADSESEEFSPILETMFHKKKEDGKRFLNLMNNIVNHCLSLPHINNEINYHIIHIPACEPWARELFFRFLIHKMALLHDDTTIKRFKEETSKIVYGTDENNEAIKKQIERNRYFKKVRSILKNQNIPQSAGVKNLVIHKETDMLVSRENKNPWINHYNGSTITNNHYNLCVDANTSAYDLEKNIRDNSIQLAIDNVFVFHAQNAISSSYCIKQLERLNRYGIGIKRCFVFSFSKQPFRLNQIIESIKKKHISIYCQKSITKYDDFSNFITFTQGESDYIFSRSSKFLRQVIDSSERAIFTDEMEIFLEDIPFNVKTRNLLSLCHNEQLQKEFSAVIKKEITDFKHEMCSGFYGLLSQVWQISIIPTIQKFIGDSKKIAFVVDRDIPANIKKSFVVLFGDRDRNVKFYKPDDIQYKKVKGSFANGVSEEKVIIMKYKSPNSSFSKYPNSFDSLCLNKNQSALEIINSLTHISFYEWDCYWYEQKLNGALYSKLRENILGWKLINLKRPQFSSPKDFIEEDEENDAYSYQTEKCKVYFQDSARYKELPLSTNIIYRTGDILAIAEIKDILEIDNISIQLLDEISDDVKVLVSKAIDENNNAENIIRSDSKYNLSKEEVSSTAELWKILLKREVSSSSVEQIYEEVFRAIPNDRISLYTFKKWCDLSDAMILPRSRRHQKAVMTYLGFDIPSAYYKVICTKKLMSINGSKKMNQLIEKLIKSILFVDIQENDFIECQNELADILIPLGVNSLSDLISLKEILLQTIDLKPVKQFDYDKQ